MEQWILLECSRACVLVGLSSLHRLGLLLLLLLLLLLA
jgi:hypothetical protein